MRSCWKVRIDYTRLGSDKRYKLSLLSKTALTHTKSGLFSESASFTTNFPHVEVLIKNPVIRKWLKAGKPFSVEGELPRSHSVKSEISLSFGLVSPGYKSRW